MSKTGIDIAKSHGNLTMSQVLTIFQNQVKLALVKKHNPEFDGILTEVSDEEFAVAFKGEFGLPINVGNVGASIEINFGRIRQYFTGSDATNQSLKNEIEEFVNNYGDGQKITFLLNRFGGDELTLTQQVFSNIAHLNASTHWTVLSLAKEGEKVVVSYADSLMAGDATHLIPPQVATSLQEVFAQKGVESEFEQFESSMQKGAECGYYAVWHALRMRNLPVTGDSKQFVEEQKKSLLPDAEKDGIKSSRRNKTSTAAGSESVDMVNRLNTNSRRIFMRDMDDSSDEESVDAKIFGKDSSNGYDLESSWNNFLKGLIDLNIEKLASEFFSKESHEVKLKGGGSLVLDRHNIRDKMKDEAWKDHIQKKILNTWIELEVIPRYTNQYKKAFELHSFGSGLLYSEEMNAKYYGEENQKGLKDLNFSDENIVFDVDSMVRSALKYSLKKTTARIHKDFFDQHTTQKEISDFLNEEAIEELVKSLSEDIARGSLEGASKSIRQSFLEFAFNEESRERCLDFIKLSLFQTPSAKGEGFGKEFSDFLEDNQIDVVPPSDLKDRDSFAKYVVQYAASQKLISPSGKLFTPNVSMAANKTAVEISAVLKGKGDLEIRRDIMTSVLQKTISGSAATSRSSFSGSSISGKVKDGDFEFVKDQCDSSKQFRREFLKNFENYVRVNLPPRRNFGHGHTFEIRKPSDFLEAVRLTNRSDVRLMKNYRDANSKDDIANFTYDVQFPRLGVIHKVDGKKIQHSDGRFSRTEFIYGGDASYPAIFNKINDAQNNRRLVERGDHLWNNRDIANFIKYSFGYDLDANQADSLRKIDYVLHSPDLDRNTRRSFLKEIAELSVLFFYAETIRNPASFVSHHMMLDLVIEGKKTWRDLLSNPQTMPMAPEGAVPEARAIHKLFNDFMPWHYKYHGDASSNSSAERLISAENNIFAEWLAAKKINSEFEKEALVLACKDWYGSEMKDVVYGAEIESENLLKTALQKWLNLALKKPQPELMSGDFEVLGSLIENYGSEHFSSEDLSDAILSEQEKGLISQKIIEYFEDRFQKSIKEIKFSEGEKEFIKVLAQNNLFDFRTWDSEGHGTLFAYLVMSGMHDAVKEILPTLSAEFLNQKMVDDITVLLQAANNGDKEMCKLLITHGAVVDDLTKETSFYQQNKDFFKIKPLENMTTLSSHLESDDDSYQSNPSPITSSRSSSSISRSRSSSRSSDS